MAQKLTRLLMAMSLLLLFVGAGLYNAETAYAQEELIGRAYLIFDPETGGFEGHCFCTENTPNCGDDECEIA